MKRTGKFGICALCTMLVLFFGCSGSGGSDDVGEDEKTDVGFLGQNVTLTQDNIGEILGGGWMNSGDIVIPEGVTKIDRFAFEHNSTQSLCVHLPDSIEEIEENAFSYSTFELSIDVNSLETWCKIKFGGIPFYARGSYWNSSDNVLEFLSVKGERVLDLVIPDSITEINDYAFYRLPFKSITIPDSVKIIGKKAFYANYYALGGNENIKLPDYFFLPTVSIGKGVEIIKEEAFSRWGDRGNKYGVNNRAGLGCLKIANLENWCRITFDREKATSADLSYSGARELWIEGVPTRDIRIPESVETVNAYAFIGHTCIDSITIPSNVKTIECSAFYDVEPLNTVTIEKRDSVLEMDNYAFAIIKYVNGKQVEVDLTVDYQNNSNVVRYLGDNPHFYSFVGRNRTTINRAE